jgi:hypothetical protein
MGATSPSGQLQGLSSSQGIYLPVLWCLKIAGRLDSAMQRSCSVLDGACRIGTCPTALRLSLHHGLRCSIDCAAIRVLVPVPLTNGEWVGSAAGVNFAKLAIVIVSFRCRCRERASVSRSSQPDMARKNTSWSNGGHGRYYGSRVSSERSCT